MIEEKLKSSDSFWDIRDREGSAVSRTKKLIDDCQRRLNLAKRVLALKSSPGYQDFEGAVADLLVHARNEMEVTQASDAYLRVLQGRCQALKSILGVMKNAESNVETLARALEKEQDNLKAIARPEHVRNQGG